MGRRPLSRERLSRREMLTALLGAPLAAQLAACDDGRAEPRGEVGGELLGQSADVGHRLRTPPRADDFAGAPTESLDAVIVGGGPAGLAAAYALREHGVERFAVLELEPRVGGTSAAGSHPLTAYPWGAHYITRPGADNPRLAGLLDAMGITRGRDALGRPLVAEQYLVREAKERVFYRGYWYQTLVPMVDTDDRARDELARFEGLMGRYAAMRGADGRPAFTIPVAMGTRDPRIAALDRITGAEFLRERGFTSERLRWYANYACRDDYGLGIEDVSAWALVFYFASRIDPRDGSHAPVITWPEGNAGLTAFLRGRVEDRVRVRHLAVDLREDAQGGGEVLALDLARERPLRLRARRIICATPQFITRRIVRRMREGDDGGRSRMQYGAWLVANLHLDGRPEGRGVPEAWDSVLYDSPSLGYVSATHQRGRSFGPTIWTYYLPFTDADARSGRGRLFSTDYVGARDAVTADLGRAHRDLSQHLRRLDVFRWGHGMIQPRPGLQFGGALEAAARPLGPVHFAHSDLSGVALFEEAFHHGVRAADEVAEALRIDGDRAG